MDFFEHAADLVELLAQFGRGGQAAAVFEEEIAHGWTQALLGDALFQGFERFPPLLRFTLQLRLAFAHALQAMAQGLQARFPFPVGRLHPGKSRVDCFGIGLAGFLSDFGGRALFHGFAQLAQSGELDIEPFDAARQQHPRARGKTALEQGGAPFGFLSLACDQGGECEGLLYQRIVAGKGRQGGGRRGGDSSIAALLGLFEV